MQKRKKEPPKTKEKREPLLCPDITDNLCLTGKNQKKPAGVQFGTLPTKIEAETKLARYLKGKGFSASVVDEMLTFEENHDYINDPHFGLRFGRSRIENKKVKKLRLERELRDKGLENQIIVEVLNSLYKEFDEHKMAIVCAKKKIQTSSSNDIKKARGRLAKFIERKGFASSLVYQMVTQSTQSVSNNDLIPSLPLIGKQHEKTVYPHSQD